MTSRESLKEEGQPQPAAPAAEGHGNGDGDGDDHRNMATRKEDDSASDAPDLTVPDSDYEAPHVFEQSGELRLPDGRKRVNKYNEEDASMESWQQRNKHILVLSNAGKPVFSRYGDESTLGSLMGVLGVIVSFIGDENGDEIRYIVAGKHKIVFLIRDPLYFVAIAKTRDTVKHLVSTLKAVHNQLLSILTYGWIEHNFNNNKAVDIRDRLGGTDNVFVNMIRMASLNPTMLLKAVQCVRMKHQLRKSLGSILHECRVDNQLFALLIARNQLLQLVRTKNLKMYPKDLMLVFNFINSCSTFQKSSESCFLPICLPKISSKGFLYAFMCWIQETAVPNSLGNPVEDDSETNHYLKNNGVCLVLLSSKPEAADALAKAKDSILERMETSGATRGIANSIRTQHYDISEIGVPYLLHFLFKETMIRQFTSPGFGPPYTTRKRQKHLFRRYQHIHAQVHSRKEQPHNICYHVTETETLVGWVLEDFELYAAFSPLVTKPMAIRGCNRLLRWIKKEEQDLFLLHSPLWS